MLELFNNDGKATFIKCFINQLQITLKQRKMENFSKEIVFSKKKQVENITLKQNNNNDDF